MKNTDLHIKILLPKYWTALLKIFDLEKKYKTVVPLLGAKYKIVVPLFDAVYAAQNIKRHHNFILV